MNTTPIKTVVCPATPETPRMVEAALLPFDDGRLYLVYSAGARADHIDGGMPEGELRLMGKWSRDAGASWSEPFVVREYEGIPNAMEPTRPSTSRRMIDWWASAAVAFSCRSSRPST